MLEHLISHTFFFSESASIIEQMPLILPIEVSIKTSSSEHDSVELVVFINDIIRINVLNHISTKL
jgi:hypothetical protein